MKILNVAEKNDAAKNLANIMARGAAKRREGYSKFNKIYEYSYDMPQFGRCQMIMTSVSGHLFNYDFTGNYRNWNLCDPCVLFKAPIVRVCPSESTSVQIKQTLEREVKHCNCLIIWTDCDREGENIGFEIIEVCKKVNSSILVYRARFSEITSQAVERALNTLTQPDKCVSDAVDVRQALDLRIGAAFTRYQTLELRRLSVLRESNNVISYGSCQFPTLGFVVERYKQRVNFVPEKFWSIEVTHDKNGLSTKLTWQRHRVFDEQVCISLLSKVLERPTARVVNIKNKQRTRWRPQPMDTVTFEKLASSKLRISAKKAMDMAEKLYTKGFISYPRTETNQFPPDINLNTYVEAQTHSHTWGQFAQRVLSHGVNPRQGNKTDKAHPPIHPLKFTTELSGDQARIYELIVRHFLACLSRDALGFETTVEFDINQEIFYLNGLVVVERNYLDVYPYDNWTNKQIPKFDLDETFTPDSIIMTDGHTTPPQLLTEAELIALMEKHGIGTDATHAEHIEKIKFRNYIQETADRRLAPGELGIGLVEGYDHMGYEMSKPHLRASLELDLQEICRGNKNPKQVLEEQLKQYERVFLESVKNVSKLSNSVQKYLTNKLPNINKKTTTTNTFNNRTNNSNNVQNREKKKYTRRKRTQKK